MPVDLETGLKRSLAQQSTNEIVLNKLKEFHPLPQLVLKYRAIQKLKSAFFDNFLAELEPDGRIRPVWDQMAAVTGRLYSSKPNLQVYSGFL